MTRLNENLQICLLSLNCRAPKSIVDINETVLGVQHLGTDSWSVPDLVELIRSTAPAMLHEPARLVVTENEAAIYLVKRSESLPALWLHCRGKIPPCKGSMGVRRSKRLSECEEAALLASG